MKQAALRIYRTNILPYKKYILITVAFALIVIVLTNNDESTPLTEEPTPIMVKVGTPAELSGAKSTELIGIVAAKTQADLQTEVGGRITSVTVTLGQRVSAGQVIATIENASERASVLQAEGVYEAALAAASQTAFGISEADTRLANSKQVTISSLRSAYTTTNSVVVTNIDKFFSQPNSPLPGLRIGGSGYTMDLNNERVALQDVLPAWQERVDSLTMTSDLQAEISYAEDNIERVVAMLDIFLYIFDQKSDDDYSADEITFTNLRSTLIATLSSVEAARSGLESANDALVRATASATGGGASTADAQVKQALGALRAAEANLAKTIIRTPIAGEVNNLSVKAGDFVGTFTPVALIANNQGLEITTYIGATERNLLTVGDELLIEGAGTGTVTNISPAIDEATGKIEVRVAVSASTLQNGDRVRLFIQEETNQTSKTIQIPLAAIKFDGSEAYVFIVVDNKLKRQSVELGDIRGDSVVILSGIENTTEIVRDARGLVEGTEVTVVTG